MTTYLVKAISYTGLHNVAIALPTSHEKNLTQKLYMLSDRRQGLPQISL